MATRDLGTAMWRKSSHSGGSEECVEVATPTRYIVAIRDSKNPDGPHLRIGRAVWRAFLNALKHA